MNQKVWNPSNYSVPDTIRIYTDWANHYLEKAKSRKFITDLQHDVTDGVLLADVIQAVTNEKIQDIKQRPRTSAQMVENISTCLTFLASLGVGVDGISAKDIKEGNLKAILGLFFGLSRYKQQQKSQQQSQKSSDNNGGHHSQTGGSKPDEHGCNVTSLIQATSGEHQSRLPSPCRQGHKIAVINSSGNSANLRGNRSAVVNTSGDKVQVHNNHQNNNNITSANSGSLLIPPSRSSGGSITSQSRSASPNSALPSGIPTAVGRGRPASSGDKQSNRTSASSTSSTSSSKSSSSKPSSSSSSSGNKNSMLDKFKFFNKDKKGVPKSSSTTSASTSSRSDSDSRGSSDTRSSSKSACSTEASTSNLALGFSPSTSGTASKGSSTSKLGKKSLARAFSTKRDHNDGGGDGAADHLRSNPQVAGVVIDPSPTSLDLSRGSPGQSRKTAGTRSDVRLGQSSPTPSKNGTKLGSFIPTSKIASPCGKISNSSPACSSTSPTLLPPPPSSVATGIPKPTTSTSTKSNKGSGGGKGFKEERYGKEVYNKALYTGLPGVNLHKTLAAKVPQQQQQMPLTQQQLQRHHQHLQQLQLQQQSKQHLSHHGHPSTLSVDQAASCPTFTTFNPPAAAHSEPGYANIAPTPTSPTTSQPSSSGQNVQGHARVNLQSQERNAGFSDQHIYSLERNVNFAHGGNESGLMGQNFTAFAPVSSPVSMAAHYVPVTIPALGLEGQIKQNFLRGVTQADTLPYSPTMSPTSSRHGGTAAVNVVKPTCAKTCKTDNNTQTNLSVLKKSSPGKRSENVIDRSSPKLETNSERSSPRMGHSSDKSSPRSSPNFTMKHESPHTPEPSGIFSISHKEVEQNDQNVTPRFASDFSQAAQVKSVGSPTTNSPKLGVKMLNSHLGKPANNVAIVQPRHGEKIETTFDTEVRTETKSSLGRETTFSSCEEKTTFVDDAGEAMDIKPMPPIMRALPYGYFRGYTGYSGLSNNRNFHIPGISVPTSVYPARAQSQNIGVNRSLMETGKFSSGNIKRVTSNCPSVNNETDYSSDVEAYDYISGYMSDGDILKSNRAEDWSSGYLSEGGASLYARRLQQRFREGMQAVRECMQKSSGGLMDDDSFDDSSSISSGDISDTIAEISTDENLTGSSQGALSDTNVYNSIKRVPRDMTQGFLTHGGPHLQAGGKRAPNLGTSAFMGTDYHSDSSVGGSTGGWRKYSLPQQTNKLLSSDPRDYAYPYSGSGYGGWSTRSEHDYISLRKLSNASHPEFSTPGDSGYGGSERTSSQSERAYSPSCSKRDCETNTDQSHLLETSMKRMQNVRTNPSISHDGNNVLSSGNAGLLGYRRPLSNTSTSSLGSGKSSTSKGSSAVGSRLAKHGVEGVTQMVRSGSDSVTHMPSGIPRPSSATSTTRSCHSDGPDLYHSSTLERKHRGGLTQSKSTGHALNDREFQSNSLGRRRLIGSKSSLSTKSAENGSLCNSTIISNPHATYGKVDGIESEGSSPNKNISHYVNLQELHARQLHQHSHSNNYVSLEYPSPSHRHSGSSTTSGVIGPSLWQRGVNGPNVPAPAPSGQETESLSKSSTMDYACFSDYAYLSSVHGSSLSLVSTSSSVYSSSEEKHAAEVRKLKRDLEAAQAKVHTLTSQLSTNAHVVSAFEQSLANMTARLQALTTSAEQKVLVSPLPAHKSTSSPLKESELNDLRLTIEALKRQSGLAAHDASPISGGRRHTSPAMISRDLHGVLMEGAGIARQISSDSVSSINSLSSACSMTSQQSAATDSDTKKSKNGKKKGWLRSSFSKAFSGKKGKKMKTGSLSDVEPDTHSLRSNASAPNSPLLQLGHISLSNGGSAMKGSHSSGALSDAEVCVLKQQLRDKDAKLTDIRLEALSSAHQLEQLRETMTKMKNEMSALKADNDRLHKLMSTSRTFNFSQSSLAAHTRTSNDSLDHSLSLTDQSSLDMLLAETAANDRDGKRVSITVYQGSNPDPSRPGLERPAEVLIGSLSVSGKTKWDILDNIVRKIFKEYVLRVDPVTNLGLSAESVYSYHVGEITRTKDCDVPELLPIGYLVGDTMQIGICLKGTKQQSVDSLAFETMIPKSIIQRYVSLLLEHRRIILCGPSGTGKTYLAQKLAEHLVLRSGRELTAGCVAVFNVDHKSSKELRQYLANIADQCESVNALLPSVIILDNLHHVASLADVFNGFLTAKYHKCPYIIGTMNQSTCSTTNLQLHHNFRWVLCANHMEPVKGFLGRYLRRKLVEAEVRTGTRNNDLNRTIDWIPKVWTHINKFLETHSSSDVTIGPRLFLSCPMDIAGSQVWFTDLWNYSIVPYILEAVRDGLQVFGRRSPWEDPTEWALQSYPWANTNNSLDRHLLHLRPEDVGYDSLPSAPLSSNTANSKQTTLPAKAQNSSTDPADPLVS